MNTVSSRLQLLMHDETFRNVLRRSLITGFGLVVASSITGTFEKIASYLWQKLKSQFMVTLTIQNQDDCYNWVLKWLAEQPDMQNARSLGVETSYLADQSAKVDLVPSSGMHAIKYRDRVVWIHRYVDTTYNMASARMFETITFTMMGQKQAQLLLRQLVNEAVRLGIQRDENMTSIYTSSNGSWTRFASRAKRPWNSVILPAGYKENLLKDASNFLDSAQWYGERGIPYRRGYLLYGTPGSGKTSLIYTIAGKLCLNICIVSLAQSGMSDELFNALLNSAPARAILLIEDIDVAFTNRNADNSKVTFSGLLNALDGVAAQEGRLLFMTTNHKESLDQALIRHGRIDVELKFGPATREQAVAMFCHFYNVESSSSLCTEFKGKFKDGASMAKIQAHLVNNRSSPKAAVETADSIFSTPSVSAQ